VHQAARVVVTDHDGQFPADYKLARALPGIGEYTAGAILSIAYGLRLPALDGNAYRVLARVFGVRGSLVGPVRRHLDGLGLAAVPAERPGDYNQALMENGSQVCLPAAPRCDECCLADICVARAHGLQDVIPPASRTTTKQVSMAAALVLRRGRVLLAKRPASGLWAGLWEFPNVETGDGAPEETLQEYLQEAFGLESKAGTRLVRITHGVMNRRIELTALVVEGTRGRTRPVNHEAVAWALPGALDDYALPAPHRKLAKRLQEHLDGTRFPL
jgi:A/G-specific adenine glycosylase